MNDAVQKLIALILQGVAWVLETAAVLWSWSWAQIASVFNISWADLPGWKLALGLAAIAVFLGILVTMFIRGWHALARIVRAFWTMTLAAFGILAFVVAAGLFSRGFQWVVQSVPDNFL
jgi:hypothetical protein